MFLFAHYMYGYAQSCGERVNEKRELVMHVIVVAGAIILMLYIVHSVPRQGSPVPEMHPDVLCLRRYEIAHAAAALSAGIDQSDLRVKGGTTAPVVLRRARKSWNVQA